MPFIGGGHIWLLAILLAIVLIIWGPGKMPEVGAGLGRAIREFRHATAGAHDAVATTATATPVDEPAPHETPVS